MNSIYRSNGKMKGERLDIKVFKDSDLMHKFLSKQPNNDWKVNEGSVVGSPLPHKAGKYAYAGGVWHNVKHLDISTLAHI